jgi:hypothetical protein
MQLQVDWSTRSSTCALNRQTGTHARARTNEKDGDVMPAARMHMQVTNLWSLSAYACAQVGSTHLISVDMRGFPSYRA